jgi:dethiobiotin synthase
MKKILVSGSGTNVGKTYFCKNLVQKLLQLQSTVQYIKPIETGLENSLEKDARYVSQQKKEHLFYLEVITLLKFKFPMAPADAARLEGFTLKYENILNKIRKLPKVKDFRIIEGAGGIAVPLEKSKKDWLDLALDLQLDMILLVVENKLGAINQSRLAHQYCRSKFSGKLMIYLNNIQKLPNEIQKSNSKTLLDLGIDTTEDVSEIINKFQL